MTTRAFRAGSGVYGRGGRSRDDKLDKARSPGCSVFIGGILTRFGEAPPPLGPRKVTLPRIALDRLRGRATRCYGRRAEAVARQAGFRRSRDGSPGWGLYPSTA